MSRPKSRDSGLFFSNTFQTVQDIGIKTWSFYRYSLTKEYHDKPTLAPPFIIINHLWRVLVYVYKKCGDKNAENDDDFSQFQLCVIRQDF